MKFNEEPHPLGLHGEGGGGKQESALQWRQCVQETKRHKTESGQSPGVKFKLSLHKVHEVELGAASDSPPLKLFRVFIVKPKAGWGCLAVAAERFAQQGYLRAMDRARAPHTAVAAGAATGGWRPLT
jgi:hypothetical protein